MLETLITSSQIVKESGYGLEMTKHLSQAWWGAPSVPALGGRGSEF